LLADRHTTRGEIVKHKIKENKMRDLYDTLITDRTNRVRDVWNETEPDFDEIFEWESDDPKENDDEEMSLDDWLNG